MASQAGSEEPIPTFTIDLAKPPRERYHEVVQVFGARMRSLTGLFDSLLSIFIASTWLRSIIVGLSRVCLRRVYDDEENEEVRGISAASGVPMYLLVALNNLLDCLLGCTSGAAPVSLGKTSRKTGGDGTSPVQTRLLHFRTLDWGMDELRDLLVVLEYVDSSSENPTRVIARSITYAGFVGSLTAVKPGLSISLNQRACHDCPSRRLRWHQLLVLLGKRKSIGSIVRSFMLRPPQRTDKEEGSSYRPVPRFVEQARALVSIPSAPCYLILCDGREAALIVKDYNTGTVRSTKGFIAQTNHDPKDHENSTAHTHEISRQDRREVIISSFEVEGWIEESTDRLQCLQKKWDRSVARYQPRNSTLPLATNPSITERTLRKWMSTYPTLNECSHFTTVLDPAIGNIRWLMRGQLEDSQD
ncbi:beta subunit of N-acylethanolamine-hydrolyzing acid amidase-domain-containing protein [Xylaria cf. heliscus]|nr:beta subunit of N-acylethanolamine-hydrolyzing acid amidase-domain-containing protein [Xylaria cf. heliscus]